MSKLPTAAEVQRLPSELRSKIAKRSSQKGGEGERGASKLIAVYFGIPWGDAFIRTKRTTGGQPNGDILPIKEMYGIWKQGGFGAIEVKNRNEWTFDQVFKNPDGCILANYWFKSREDTKDNLTVVVFTKPGVSYYILHPADDFVYSCPNIRFKSQDQQFRIVKLTDFLKERWPK